MLLRTCHRKFMCSLSGLSPGFSDMATSQVAPLWRSSHRLCTSRSSNHGASSSSKRIVQRLAVAAPADSFYAVGTSFQKLGLSSSIADAIQKAGFSEPAQIQADAIPAVLSGSDIAIASETGSGKTLAYLLPIIHSLKQRQKDQQENRPDTAQWFHHCALVLCPNMELAEQVAATAQSLTVTSSANTGAGSLQPLCSARVVSARNPPPPRAATDIVVSTPAALCNLLDEAGGAYGAQWEAENLAQCVRHVVADEADALFTSDSFLKPLTRLLDLMRGSDRAFAARAVASGAGVSVEEFEGAKRGFKMAAFQGGLPAMVEQGWKPENGSLATDDDGNILGLQDSVPGDLWVGKLHRCRSYIFVGATFPRAGGKSVAADLSKRFPDMRWLEGKQLHASKRGVRHDWVKVSEDDRSEVAAAVVTALRGQRQSATVGHALVFCRDTASARAMHEELQMVGIEAALYHKKLPEGARKEALQKLREREGGVLVCTDAAARGLDFPSISHVIQADFADNAVDFLHRIGRTARADRGGTVTSCYSVEREDLALAIKQAIAEGTPVEGTFSRNRSFSGKMKKHGRFIPRGSTA